MTSCNLVVKYTSPGGDSMVEELPRSLLQQSVSVLDKECNISSFGAVDPEHLLIPLVTPPSPTLVCKIYVGEKQSISNRSLFAFF